MVWVRFGGRAGRFGGGRGRGTEEGGGGGTGSLHVGGVLCLTVFLGVNSSPCACWFLSAPRPGPRVPLFVIGVVLYMYFAVLVHVLALRARCVTQT